MMQLKAAGLSHVGMKRNQNQDSFMLAPELGLFIVADGMGGHKGGQIASLMAVTTIIDFLRDHVSKNGGIADARATLTQALEHANQAIQKKGQTEVDLAGMGTTATALLFHGGKLFIAHVGDSRSYLVHPNRIWQITRDHSLVQEKLRAGLITREQMKSDQNKNVITRSVGFEPEVDVDLYEIDPHPGDVFVVCSDGLSGMISDSIIREVVEKRVFSQNSVEKAAKELIEKANLQGGDDNVTAVVIQLHE